MALSFEQNIRFRNTPEQVEQEFSFDGGLVTDVHETKLGFNQSPDQANIIYNNTKSIKTRNGFTRHTPDPVGVAADQSNTGASTGSLALTAPGDYVAQTFQASGAISTLKVDVYLGMQTSGETQLVRVELWSTTAGVPVELIDNGTGQIRQVSGTSETLYPFKFKVPATISAATTYAIVIKPFVRGSTNTSNQVNVYHRGATYANGQVYTSTDSGLNWTGDANKDLRFVVYSGGNTANTGLIRYYNSSGVQQQFMKVGTSLYRVDDNTGATTAITLGSGASLVTANFTDYAIVNDTLLVVDDSNKIQKYRGSTNANYTTGTITATNASATVTGSGTTWATSTNAEVGEYIKLPDGKWYKITAIASDTSLTIEISYQGATLAGQTYTISPWGEVQGKLGTATAAASLVRPTSTYIANHANRVWTLTDNTLRFSALDTSITEEHFNDWDTSNNAGAIIIPSGSGDSGTGLYSLGNTLYVFQRHATWAVYGNSPGNFELRNINNEIGLINRRTLVEVDNFLIFLSDMGIQLFDGANMRNVSDGVVNTLINSWANKTSPVATLWDNKYIISYTPSAGAYNSESLVYHIQTGVFSKLTGTYVSSWCTWGGGTDDGRVMFGSSTQGSMFRWDVGGNDDGYEIDTSYDTAALGFGAGINDKTIKKFYIQQLAMGDYEMDVTQITDLGSTTTTGASINLSGGDTSLWDVMEWDVDSWSSEGELITTRVAEFQGIAKYTKYRIEQTGYDEGVEVIGMLSTSRVRRLR